MGTLQKFPPKSLLPSPLLMNSVSSHSTPKSFFGLSSFRRLCTSSVDLGGAHLVVHGRRCWKRHGVGPRVSDSQLKENWLDSLSCPFAQKVGQMGINGDEAESSTASASDWVIGIDPDISGALAVLKGDGLVFSAQVFDTPHLQVSVGKRVRKRLDARSIVQLLRSFEMPYGTTAYVEQSRPFPKDGKQGWWSGGFGYGLWIGILVASGFSVVPVPSLLWKNQFELCGSSSTKIYSTISLLGPNQGFVNAQAMKLLRDSFQNVVNDDSRKAASALFPSLSSLLKRKKDHGRAEALLIAAYGKGLKMPLESCGDSDASEVKC